MARIDYLRLGYVYDVRESGAQRFKQDLLSDWTRVFEEVGSEDYRISSSIIRGGQTMVVLETWGERADWLLTTAIPWSYGDKLIPLRIDYRMELNEDISTDNIYYAVCAKGGANVHTFNSRPRMKKGDKDGGGLGFAVGSHKSDRRLSVYKRTSEKPALEMQFRKRVLSETWYSACYAYRKSPADKGTTHAINRAIVTLVEFLKSETESFVLKQTGNTIDRIYSGEILLQPDAQEKLLEEIESRWRALEPQSKQLLLEILDDEDSSLIRYSPV